MENIFVYLYICIYNFMYTFLAAQLWERKINTTARWGGIKSRQLAYMGSFLNKATEKTNVTSRMYKILLLCSACDEQQTDYNWPLHIMRKSGSLYYKVYWRHWCVASPPYTHTHKHDDDASREEETPSGKWANDNTSQFNWSPTGVLEDTPPWRRVECRGDDDSKHSKDSTDTSLTHLVTLDESKKQKKTTKKPQKKQVLLPKVKWRKT